MSREDIEYTIDNFKKLYNNNQLEEWLYSKPENERRNAYIRAKNMLVGAIEQTFINKCKKVPINNNFLRELQNINPTITAENIRNISSEEMHNLFDEYISEYDILYNLLDPEIGNIMNVLQRYDYLYVDGSENSESDDDLERRYNDVSINLESRFRSAREGGKKITKHKYNGKTKKSKMTKMRKSKMTKTKMRKSKMTKTKMTKMRKSKKVKRITKK